MNSDLTKIIINRQDCCYLGQDSGPVEVLFMKKLTLAPWPIMMIMPQKRLKFKGAKTVQGSDKNRGCVCVYACYSCKESEQASKQASKQNLGWVPISPGALYLTVLVNLVWWLLFGLKRKMLSGQQNVLRTSQVPFF